MSLSCIRCSSLSNMHVDNADISKINMTTVCTQFMFNSQPGDVFGCVADLGWMAGHTCVVYGPLCNGETTVLFEGQPWEPYPGKYA